MGLRLWGVPWTTGDVTTFCAALTRLGDEAIVPGEALRLGDGNPGADARCGVLMDDVKMCRLS